jgi:hypothetical protein
MAMIRDLILLTSLLAAAPGAAGPGGGAPDHLRLC